MNLASCRRLRGALIFAAAARLLSAASGPAQPYATVPATLGTGGFQLVFDVTWTCDDSPGDTTSLPGRIDLVDGGGNLVTELTATATPAGPQVTVAGPGQATGLHDAIHLYGAADTPADGHVSGTWTIQGPSPGAYTLRFWTQTAAVANHNASTITTVARDAGGAGTLGGPAAPPAIALVAPPSATVLAGVPLSATATAGTAALAAVALDASLDGGATWSSLAAAARPAGPSATVTATLVPAAVEPVLLRATATDAAGLTATASQTIAVGKASQGPVQVSPAALTLVAGQSGAFTASGGATGNYSWSGSAAGTGAAARATFAVPGTYTVDVLDLGNALYLPSAAAAATITVQPAFETLTIGVSGDGAATGGGSYAPNAVATAVATPAPGYAFTGWSGDAAGTQPTVSLTMNGNKALVAHFTPLLAQTIIYTPPGPLSVHSPAFALGVSATSGLPVTLVLNSGPAAVTGTTLSPTGTAGEVTLTATQPGNAVYLPAAPLVITLAIGPAPAGVLFADDAGATRRTDRTTRNTSFTSAAGH